MTLEEFIEVWWDAHPGLEDTPMGSNGQFDEIPYAEYERHEAVLSALSVTDTDSALAIIKPPRKVFM